MYEFTTLNYLMKVEQMGCCKKRNVVNPIFFVVSCFLKFYARRKYSKYIGLNKIVYFSQSETQIKDAL